MEKLKSRLNLQEGKSIKISIKSVVFQCIFGIIGLLMSFVSFTGGISPFALGYICGIDSIYLITSCVGVAVGYLLSLGILNSLRFVCAVCLICFIRICVYDRIIIKYRTIFCTLLGFFTSFLSSLAVFIAVGSENTFIILCFCESLICASFSAFTLRLFGIISLKKEGALFSPTDMVAVIFFSCVLLLAFDEISIFGFSFARTIAYFAILVFALCSKEFASCIAGICCALTLGFNDEHPELLVCYTLVGLFAGLTGNYGKIPVSLSLVVSTGLALILKGNSETAVFSLSEAITAAIVFLCLPEKYLYSLAKAFVPLGRDAFDEEKGRVLRFTLKRSAKAVKDISKSVIAVSELLHKNEKNRFESFTEFVKDDICKQCNKYDFCWNKCKDLSNRAFTDAQKILIKNGKIYCETLPDRIRITCRLPDKIADSFNTALFEHNAKIVARKDLFEAQKAAAKQFHSLGAILEDAAENLCTIPKSDPVLSSSLIPVFKQMGFSVIGISAICSQNGKSILQVYCSHVPAIPRMSTVLDKLFEVTGKSYLEPVADEYSEEGCVLCFTEECKYTVEYHTGAHTGTGEEFSGDSKECFFDGNGNFYVVLSDGMGSGSRAAIDSVMTCSLMSRLLRAGFSAESALDAVNCALMVKSAEETLSTVDILKINLETGRAVFLKAGAAFSIIKTADKTLVVEKSSMPLGILKETEFEKSEISLSLGDTILIMSDGAACVSPAAFKDMLRENKTAGVVSISQKAVDMALEMSPSGKHDDITVVCVKLKSAA